MFRWPLHSAPEPSDPKPGERWQLAHSTAMATVLEVCDGWVRYDMDNFKKLRKELALFKRLFHRHDGG